MTRTLLLLAAPLAGFVGAAQPPAALPSPAEMAAAREDVWGEAALRHPGGPSYEFFRDLLPPLRYTNTEFRHYPIVLSAPLAPVKARFISNGSGINLRANKPPMWKEAGVPVSFFVGEKPEPFGADIERLDNPWYTDGWLPVVQVGYTAGGVAYRQEAFAAARGPLADHGAVFVRFAAGGKPGRVFARVSGRVDAKVGAVLDEKGNAVVLFRPGWMWNAEKGVITSLVVAGKPAELVVFTKPAAPPKEYPSHDEERKACVETWTALLARGSSIAIPEPVVQNAWRALVVGQYTIAVGNRMHYSAGNAYDHL